MQHSRFLWTVLSFAILTLTGSTVTAQEAVAFQPNLNPTLNVEPTTGSFEIDGDLSDAGWQTAARAGNFSEVGPGDNTRPDVRSEALITYDESNLYVALIAYDNRDDIRASMSDRDNIFRDDYMGLLFDTYGDHAWAYEIFVNPYGIQGDLRQTSNGGEDISLDLVFESRGIVTDSGYQVELAIPFASLRFPDQTEQVWRATFWRDRQRDNRYRYSWSAQDLDNSCWLCTWGTLTGIRDIKPGTNLDILPNIIAYQSGGMNNTGIPDSDYGADDPDAELSLNVRYGLSTNSSLEVTVNPDFSQVESDAGQIDVNETFALSYPERRPFFQEGSDLYQSFVSVAYTRSINDPVAAAKLTGQWGRYSLIYLAARDDNTPLTIPLRETSFTVGLENSTVNILRGRRTFGQDSYAGFFLTDRRVDGTVDYEAGSGSVLAFDSRIRLNSNYRLQLMALGSHTKEPNGAELVDDDSTFDYGSKTVALDGESFKGHGLVARLNRGGRTWGFNIDYREFSPTFRPDNGRIQGNDKRTISLYTDLTFYPNKEWLIDWGPTFNMMRVFNHRAEFTLNPKTFNSGIRDEGMNIGARFNLKGQTRVQVTFLASRETFKGTPQTGITRGFFNFNTRPTGAIDFGGNYEYGKKVIRRLDELEMRMGLLTNLTVYGGFRISERLQVSPTLRYQKMNERDRYLIDHPSSPRNVYEQLILRARTDYQFNREWFLRLIVEYLDFNDSEDDNFNYVSIQPLLTYRINPFTKFYIGASWGGQHYYEGYNFTREFTNPDGTTYETEHVHDHSTWRLNQAQVFAKFQYLFRL